MKLINSLEMDDTTTTCQIQTPPIAPLKPLSTCSENTAATASNRIEAIAGELLTAVITASPPFRPVMCSRRNLRIPQLLNKMTLNCHMYSCIRPTSTQTVVSHSRL